MTAPTPGQAHPLDLYAVAGYAVWADVSAEEAMTALNRAAPHVRENWRAVADAVLSLNAVQPQDGIVSGLRSLVWDMLGTMDPSPEAFGFAVRAGQLGVTDEQDRPLVPACAPQDDDFVQDRHVDLDAGEFGGAMTDADYYDRTAGASE